MISHEIGYNLSFLWLARLNSLYFVKDSFKYAHQGCHVLLFCNLMDWSLPNSAVPGNLNVFFSFAFTGWVIWIILFFNKYLLKFTSEDCSFLCRKIFSYKFKLSIICFQIENKITTVMILKNNGGYFLKQSSTFLLK